MFILSQPQKLTTIKKLFQLPTPMVPVKDHALNFLQVASNNVSSRTTPSYCNKRRDHNDPAREHPWLF